MQYVAIPPDLDLWEWLWDEENTVSASSLNMFLRCPRQWRYKSLGFPTIEMDMTAANFGTDVHNAISAFYNSLSGEGWLTPDGIRERAEAYLYKIENRPRGKSMKKIVDELVKFELWRQKRYPFDSQIPKCVEHYFKVPPFHGYIDFAAHDFVLDWKTGSGQVNPDYVRQVNVYFYAGMGLDFEAKKGFLMFIETGMKPMIPINLEKVLKEAWAFFQLTGDSGFSYPPNRTYMCRWCGWRNLCEREEQSSHEFIASRLIRKRIQRLSEVGLFERKAEAATA
jgi:CRISPR/Cas system-associated exonuclease Cas4 (RecB family)